MNGWYAELVRPPLTPPSWIFSPVWTLLYLMIAASIVIWTRSPDRFLPGRTWKLLTLHLLTNACWTLFFFRLQSPLLALVDIVVLDLTLLGLLCIFRRQSRTSFWLLVPYLFWVSFATYLNAGFWWLNR
jgi:tryptophan-rich sensory protein